MAEIGEERVVKPRSETLHPRYSFMPTPPHLDLIEILERTLRQIETAQKFGRDDPTLRKLEHRIVRAIAEVETARLRRPKAA